VDKREQYRPLMLRTIENYQVEYLSRKFDFSKESRIARLIVQEINEAMSVVEKKLNIVRVKPFELFIQRSWRKIKFPLFQPRYLEPLYEGNNFSASRELIKEECLKRLRQHFPQAGERELLEIIDPWALVRGNGPSIYQEEVKENAAPYNEEDTKFWRNELSKLKPLSPKERLKTPDLSAPADLLHNLTTVVQKEAGMGKTTAGYLVEEVITLRNLCCPRADELNSGEMPLLATHVKARLSKETQTQFRRIAPVIITVWQKEELKNIPMTVPEYLALLKKRIIRVCFEAYRQNGLLTLQELQWIFQISIHRVSELIRSFQNEHNIIVPTPGTVLDAGRSMTHKDIIVRLYQQGYNFKQIAAITHHSPRSIHNYIDTFESVLILYFFNVPKELIARILKKGNTLIDEYISLIEEFYDDRSLIKDFLQKRGVKIQNVIYR